MKRGFYPQEVYIIGEVRLIVKEQQQAVQKNVFLLLLLQSVSRVWLCHPVDCSIPGVPVLHCSWNSLRFMSTESMALSNHLFLCCHPILLLLPSIFPSIRVFSSESVLHIRWPEYWSFSISPPSAYSGLIFFRIDWFDLAVQGTLKILLQHHHWKATVLQCSAFFMVHKEVALQSYVWIVQY